MDKETGAYHAAGTATLGQPRMARVVLSVVLALFLLFSCSFLNALDALALSGSEVSRMGSRNLGDSPLHQLMTISEYTPPAALLLILLVPPFFSKYLHRPRRGEAAIIVVACLLALLIIGTAAITSTKTLHVLISTPFCMIMSILSFAAISVFLFTLIAAAFAWLRDHLAGSNKGGSNGSNGGGGQGSVTPPCKEHEPQGEPSHTNEDALHARRLSPRKWFWCAFAIIVLGWLPYLIVFFPGSVCYDFAFQLAQLEGLIEFNTEHSVFSTLLYGSIYHLGESIAGPNAGVFSLVLMQVLTMGAALSFEVYLMCKLRAPQWALVVSALFFALTPTFGASVQWCMKDALFTAVFIVYATLIIVCSRKPDAFLKSTKWTTLITLAAIICGLLRSNAVIMIVLSLPFICLFTKGLQRRMLALIPAALALIATIAITAGLNTAVQANTQGGATELSAPMQQIARVIALENDLTQDELSFIEQAFGSVEEVGQAYEEELVDAVKNYYKENSAGTSALDLLKVWVSIGIRHPEAYLDSMAHMTYGYLCVVPYPEYENVIAFFTQPGSDLFGYSFAFPESIRNAAEEMSVALQDLPGLGVVGQPGLFTWLVMLECAYLVFVGRKRDIITLLPVMVMILTILAGPVNGSIRYFLPIMSIAPIMLWNTLLPRKHNVVVDEEDDHEDRERNERDDELFLAELHQDASLHSNETVYASPRAALNISRISCSAFVRASSIRPPSIT